LSDSQILACGFHSLRTASAIQKALCWKRYEGTLGECLCIPFADHAGKPIGYSRLKPDRPRKSSEDGKPIKYESPKGSSNRAYFPPATRTALALPSAPLIVTEGEKKSAKADQEGFPCIGLVGVYGWQKKGARDKLGKLVGDRELIDDLATVAWQGRQVYICFDSDAATNPRVRLAEWHLAEALTRQSARVKVMRLPAGEPGADGTPGKVGLDDYLVSHGPDAFRELLAGAVEPRQPDNCGKFVLTAPPGLTTPPSPDWPEPPDEMAYHGLAGEIIRAIEPHTEADPAALLVQLLAMFGNAAGRGPHCFIEAARHGLNEFAVIVGDSANGRKGTSFNHVRKLFEQPAPEWTAERIMGGLSSGEGLIFNVRDPGPPSNDPKKPSDPGVEDKRLLVVESEFANVLRVANRQTNTISAVIRNAWDGITLRTMTRNNALKATDAHVSILGHITPEELRRELNDISILNGFANRFLFVAAKRSKIRPWGGRLPDGELERLQSAVGCALDHARRLDRLDLDKDARRLWESVYETLTTAPPGSMGAIYNRSAPHVRRLAMIQAAMNGCERVSGEHLSAALALWQFCADSARYIFGESTGNPLADDVLEYLRAAQELGMTRTEISNALGRHVSASRLTGALTTLERAGKVRREEIKDTGGRPSEKWYATGGKTAP
jgi:hypothetical protein